MTQAIRIHIDNQDRLSGLRSFLATVMEKTEIEAMLVPTRLVVKNRIMPTLVSDPKRLAEAELIELVGDGGQLPLPADAGLEAAFVAVLA